MSTAVSKKTVIQSEAQRQTALRRQVIGILNFENTQLRMEVEEREITLGRQIVWILELENHLKQHGIDV